MLRIQLLLLILSGAPLQAKPGHSFVFKVNPEVDQMKPLAFDPFSQWVAVDSMLVGAWDEHWIGAFDHRKNQHLWWYPLKARAVLFAAHFEGRLYFGQRDGLLLCLSAKDGELIWKQQLDSYVARDFVQSSGAIYAVTARQQMYALNPQNGEIIWIYDAGIPDGLAIRNLAPPLVVQNEVLLGTSGGEIQGIDRESGKQLWRMNPQFGDGKFQDVIGQMVVFSQNVLVSRYDGVVASFNPKQGDRNVLWKEELSPLSTSAFRDGRLYVSTLSGKVLSLDASNGKSLWQTEVGQAASSILVTDQELWVAGMGGLVFKLSLADGRILWHRDLGSRIAAKPILSHRELLFMTAHNVIYGFAVDMNSDTSSR